MSGHAAVSAYGPLTGDPRTPDPSRRDRLRSPMPIYRSVSLVIDQR